MRTLTTVGFGLTDLTQSASATLWLTYQSTRRGWGKRQELAAMIRGADPSHGRLRRGVASARWSSSAIFILATLLPVQAQQSGLTPTVAHATHELHFDWPAVEISSATYEA